ncbi:MAG: serine hydrolase [Spirosomataceae bacterium]
MTKKFAWFLLILAIAIQPVLGQKKKGIAPDNFQELDAFVSRMLNEWNVPGTSVAIVKDGKVLYTRGYGIKNLQTSELVTERTLFGIASCSKSFTAACLAILADEGKLDWNKPVKEYMPDFQLQDEHATRTVTARELVSHRTGLPRHDLLWAGSGLTRKQLFERLRYIPPSAPAFSTYQYNNLMYMAAGVLVERLSGKTWEDFVKEKILIPLNMSSTVLTYSDLFKTSDYSKSYVERNGQMAEAGFLSNVDAIGPAGSIKSNALDMAKWLLLQLGKGKLDDEVIVSEKNLKENHTPQAVVVPAEVRYSELGFGAYAMGWNINMYRGHLRRQHNGSIEGYRSQMTVFPNDNLGIFVTTNTGVAEYYFVNTITNFIVDKWLTMSPIDWSGRYKQEQAEGKANQEKQKQENIAKRVTNAPPTHPLEAYAGEYQHPAYGVISLKVTDGKLAGSFHVTPLALQHYHYDVFEGTSQFEMVKFNFAPATNGNIETVVVNLPSAGEITFKKK